MQRLTVDGCALLLLPPLPPPPPPPPVARDGACGSALGSAAARACAAIRAALLASAMKLFTAAVGLQDVGIREVGRRAGSHASRVAGRTNK